MMTSRGMATVLILFLALAGLLAGGAEAGHPVPDGAAMAMGADMPDRDGCAGDGGAALACALACAAAASGELGPVPAAVTLGALSDGHRAGLSRSLPPGVAIAPDPPPSSPRAH